MDLINTTPFAADFFNTVVDEDRMLGSVVIRTIHRIENNVLVPDPTREWPVTGDPYETEFGEFDGETPFVREGCDLFLLGYAYSSTDPAKTTVELRVGSHFSHSIRVFGDRKWERRGERLAPSEPEPFSRIPLTWDRAFGGTTKVEGLDVPFSANPNGCGFYWESEQAEGSPLPNLEDPKKIICEWNDRPDPVGTAPYSREWALRALNSAEIDTSGEVPTVRRIKPSYFNNAVPRLILPRAPGAGESVIATSVCVEGDNIEFRMPSAAYHTFVQLDDRRYVFPVQLEALAILAEEGRVMLGYRCCFRYRFRPMERRAAVLFSGEMPDLSAAGYMIDWARFDAKGSKYF
jgi:hypothetical protein